MVRTSGLVAAALSLFLSFSCFAQDVTTHPRARITERIDAHRLVTLTGNVHPKARPANDRGAVTGDFRLDHMLLQLQRAPEQEQALQALINQQHDPSSANYHQWLTAEQFGNRFGAADTDIATVSGWLRSQGFEVNGVAPNHLVVDFSGSAEQVRQAFHTEIHHLDVQGERHFANMSNPQIPAALSPVVHGIVSLHDFPSHPLYKARPPAAERPQFTSGTREWVAPADLATIYNLNPLFNGGIYGQGQTIAVVEYSDIYSSADISTFRGAFNLIHFGGTLTTTHPTGPLTCTPPGVGTAAIEATLDAEWAGAAAPGANIVVASCANTTMGGERVALFNLINSPNPPGIISMSYGECEAALGAASNYQVYTTAQQAAAEGISLFVSSGDASSAACDQGSGSPPYYGIAVSGLASTPYNVAVGGTDFQDTYQGSTGSYWSSSNGTAYSSALSYVPEAPWNDSCASSLVLSKSGYLFSYGSTGYCQYTYNQYLATYNSSYTHYFTAYGGGGGPSGCATGTPSSLYTVSGSCAGYPKPSWQAGVFGNPNDNVRDLPDVSLFAATGLWGHSYVVCFSQTSAGGYSCAGDPSTWWYGGGTSFSTPVLAGIQALVNQYTGHLQGNPNYVYYKLAAAAFGSSGNSTCDASLGRGVASACVFHDVTTGDINSPCQSGRPNCYAPTGTIGVLSTSTLLYSPAFKAGSGWDFASGLGSVNAYNLVMAWNSVTPNYTLTVAMAGNGSVTSSPAGIACSGNCSASFDLGKQVTLTATPAAGWNFVAWTGACGGSGTCTVSLYDNATVVPVFHQATHPVLH